MASRALGLLFCLVLLGRGQMLNNTCEGLDKELEQLVRAPKTRAIMYIMAHNNESKAIAESYRRCREDWTRVAQIVTTPFFESIVYRSYLPYQASEFAHVDYVILAPYKVFSRKMLPRYMPVLKFNNIRRLLRVARAEDYDVVPFMRDFEEMMPTSVKYHTEAFKFTWNALLQNLGYNMSVIESLYSMKAFYRNAFIIKPKVLVQLMDLMSSAIHTAEDNVFIRSLLRADAKYILGQKDVAMRVFGTPYYQLHPFVFERLPAFFLYASGARICMGPGTPCKYNYNGDPGRERVSNKPAPKT
ncbi:hypothetical protein EON65_39225 [archaeon]|nr:MAG: hypothetical protein EON65_39225 [archaeon]